MEKCWWGVGATSGIYRFFHHEAPIAVVYYLRDRIRFARSAQAHDLLALLHEQEGAKFEARFGRGKK
jgi:hypothetical protein